jgi:membrane-bound inhibitor of C-type lysozyme
VSRRLAVAAISISTLFLAACQRNSKPVAKAEFACSGGKTIHASFFKTAAKLALSDGRSLTLPQTRSADGARYAGANDHFVFWAKGNGATITENSVPTFTGCIRVAPDSGNLPHVYESGSEGFSIRYPAHYTVNSDYSYQELGPGKSASGVKFTIDPAIAKGTNLGSDSYISVEEMPRSNSCDASLFLGNPNSRAHTLTESGTTYSVATSTGAGAGNRYLETIFAIPGTNPCMAVRYFIHYSVLANYPSGAVHAFDSSALKQQFDSIRQSLVIDQ